MPVTIRQGRAIMALAGVAAVCVALVIFPDLAHAQARNPFGVGISEGGGSASGFTGWLLSKQAEFERMLSGAVRAVRTDPKAIWTLTGLSFAYGVFHAAGPGHGKAVVASYMLANEQALRRGLVIAFLAALMQGAVAIAIVGILAALLRQTARQMTSAASMIETASYLGITALGAWLLWSKGRALWRAWRAPAPMAAGRFVCEAVDDDPAHIHGPDCGHMHMPDPTKLGVGFSWRTAAATVVAAGSRPCSGAILVLAFALAQGAFLVGVGATIAMSLGTAITTGSLAAIAVLAKSLALRMTGPASRRSELVTRAAEFIAALAVFGLGSALVIGYMRLG